MSVKKRKLLSSSAKYFNVMLYSSKAIRKEPAKVTVRLGRPSPDPRFSSPVELRGGRAGGLRDLIRIGKALPCQGIAAEEAPPALPARLSQHAPTGMKICWMRG
jgi:hypothetical protein